MSEYADFFPQLALAVALLLTALAAAPFFERIRLPSPAAFLAVGVVAGLLGVVPTGDLPVVRLEQVGAVALFVILFHGAGSGYLPRVSSLSWWFAAHPAWEPGEDWPQEVPVVCFETDDEVVIIDPFLPQDGSFDPHGKRVRVLLTQGAHHRGTAELVERYGASVWTPPHAVWRKIPNPATTDELPAGIEALELDGEPQQVVFFIPEHATLVTGDVLTGRGGVMRVFVDEADREPLLASLERIAELPIKRVIVPHGETPIFVDGAARIRAAVAEARQS